MPASSNALALTGYVGDGAVLLAFSLDPNELKANELAGFSIQCTPPAGPPFFLENRLNFSNPVTSSTTPQQAPFTSSQNAPFQKFHWVFFPADILPGNYHFEVTARYCHGATMADGPKATVAVQLAPQAGSNFELGLTRGYISSQAYASKFGNKVIRPLPKSLDYNTQPFQPQYEWLGYHARQMIFDLMNECVADPSITVDLFAYDLDEPDVIDKLEALGTRLRAVLDNAPLHLGTALEVIAHARLVKSAGASNILQGHFSRFAHDKIIIAKKNGQAVKVLTGSANFSVRGLYVQANNVLLFTDPKIAGQYEQVFQSVFTNMSGFSSSPLAAQWFNFPNEGGGIPNFSVSFAPHKVATVSLAQVQQALNNAKSSIMFAIMELQGGGSVLQTIQNLHLSGKVFSYGMTQAVKGFKVYQPGQPGVLIPFDALVKNVPPPFNQEFTGGPGQVIHDKFIVVDFNDENPVVFTGSSNLAQGGEQQNGDNLLAIHDARVAEVFAVEAMRLVDHYQFRAAAQTATQVKPLQLTPCGSQSKWWAPNYDPNDMRNVQRELFASGPSAVTSVPKGISGTSTGAPTSGGRNTAKGAAAGKKSSSSPRSKK
jgi:phosphatidylserine/phosphatidylglycerophosphate/cardiolipin synthase-like enzyme